MASQQPQCSYNDYGLDCQVPALDGQDKCLFHAPAEAKDAGEFYAAIKEKMARGDFDFRGYVFPSDAYFRGAQFTGAAYFSRAQFSGNANFSEAQFSGNANFSEAQFSGDANFIEAQFSGNANFSEAQFSGDANFIEAQFSGDAYFLRAQFSGDAYFWEAQFTGDADFSRAQFSSDAYFLEARFSGAADFSGARFNGVASFREAPFTGGNASFWEAEFSKYASFRETKFPKGARFQNASWLERCLLEKAELGPGTTFQEASLEHVIFRSLDLSHCSFKSAYGIESTEFDDIDWDKRYGRDSIADELAARDSNNPQVTFADAERVYLHLRRSYQARLDYPRAREFYYGEMEMRRLAGGPWPERLLVNLFYGVSGYGQRWVRAAGWLIGITLAFAFAYAFSGLIATQDGTLLQIIPDFNEWSRFGEIAGILGESLLYSINAAVLRPSDFARPFSGWGRAFQALELVLGPAFITILVLAIREQFRR